MTNPRGVSRGTVAIIGTGLIGTSVGLALAAHGRRNQDIVGWDRRKAVLSAAFARGGITRRARSFEDALSGASTVVLAMPLDVIQLLVSRVVRTAARGAFVVDVGSVKIPVVAAVRRSLDARPDVKFASGHPLAGSETSGPAQAHPALFAGRPFALVVPTQRRRTLAGAAAAAFARRLRAVPVRMSAAQHDRICAATSALPQLASTALALAVDAAIAGRAKTLVGPGFRDATRLAASPYHIWRPAIAANSRGIRRALRYLVRALGLVGNAVDRGDEGSLARLFSRAASARRRVVGN